VNEGILQKKILTNTNKSATLIVKRAENHEPSSSDQASKERALDILAEIIAEQIIRQNSKKGAEDAEGGAVCKV
jgi:hypothetical protein